jgi:putative ABC transport system substrate-binding protein
MPSYSRRRFLRDSVMLTSLGALAGCGLVPQRAPWSTRLPRLGILGGGTPGTKLPGRIALEDGLRELGWVEGETVVFESRGTAGDPTRAPALASELAGLKLDAIFTSGTPQAVAVRQATSEIPIITAATGDLVALGLIESLRRPGGNVTGVVTLMPQLSGKRLELLKEAIPRLSRVGLLVDQIGLERGSEVVEVRAAAHSLGLALEIAAFHGLDDLDDAVAALATAGAEGLLVTESQGGSGRDQTIQAVARHALPAIYTLRELVDAGGLMAYGPNYAIDTHRRAAAHVDKILRGARPADLPVEQPTTFELVVNLKSAQPLGLTIPPAMVAQATATIQ